MSTRTDQNSKPGPLGDELSHGAVSSDEACGDVKDLVERLVATVGCASTPGDWNSLEQVRSALAKGERAALEGRVLPVGVLLDLEAIAADPGFGAGIGNRRGAMDDRAVTYDDWLREMQWTIRTALRDQRQRLRAAGLSAEVARAAVPAAGSAAGGARGGRTAVGAALDYLPLVLHVWRAREAFGRPVRGDQPLNRWFAAYAALRSAGVERIYRAWCGDRTADANAWALHWSQAADEADTVGPAGPSAGMDLSATAAVRRPPALLFCLLASTGTTNIATGFEHAAGHLYLNGDDPEILPDQARRLRRLRVRRQMVYEPVKREPTDQDPYIGLPPLAALCREPLDQVIHALMNHEVSWLNSQPATRPPRVLHLHLCWLHTAAAAEADHGTVKLTRGVRRLPGPSSQSQPVNPAGRARSTYAATLKALAGLLLDDWRNALVGLPVRFHLHRGFPFPNALELGRPGERWKKTIDRGVPPPPGWVENLFRRHSLLDLHRSALGWGLDEGRTVADWFCGIVLARDLQAFGFAATERNAARPGIGTPVPRPGGAAAPPAGLRPDRLGPAPASEAADPDRQAPCLPPALSHLIVLKDERGVGRVFEIRRLPGTDGLALWPAKQRRDLNEPDARSGSEGELAYVDPSFLALRVHALDTVIDVLEAKLS